MLTPIVLVIVLMVATCVIAYWSDNLGKKLGKKRITLFNLRPRQTATLITMASSVGIMLLTLAGLLFVNTSLRHALFYYDKLRDTLTVQSAQLVSIQNQTRRANQAKEQAEQDKDKAERDQLSAAQGRDTAKRDLVQAQKNLTTAQGELRTAQSGKSAAEARQRGAESKAGAAEARVARAQAQYDRAQTRYTQAQDRFTKAQTRLISAQIRLTSVQTRLTSVQTSLSSAKVSLATAKDTEARAHSFAVRVQQSSVESIRRSATKLAEADAKVADAETRLARLQQELADNEQALTTAREARKEAENAALQAKFFNAGFQAGAVIATPDSILAAQSIPAGQSRAQVETILQKALREGSEFAQSLGTSEQPVKGVTLENLSLLGRDNKPTYTLTSAEIIPTLAQHLENSPTPISLILLPTRFHVLGEKSIEARFIYLEVKKMFSEGEEVSRVSVNTNASDAQLFKKLQDLSDDGRAAAVRRGVPGLLVTRAEFYADGTFDSLLATIRRAQTWAKDHPTAKTVTIQLVAAADLTTAEQMRVRFEIAPE